jgi:hypothetical protein
LIAGEHMSAQAENSTHDEAFLLLPWYANGTLDGSQKRLIDEHARSCIVCRRALSAEYRTLDVFRSESPLDQSIQAGFERLHNRITAGTPSPAKSQSVRPANTNWTPWKSLVDMLQAFTGNGLRLALLAAPLAVVAFVAVSVALTYFAREQYPVGGAGHGNSAAATDGYHTLSNPVVKAANVDDVHVIFTRDTSPTTIEDLLESLPARILAGPDSAGVYTVQLLNVRGDAERQAAITGLRSKPQVMFAEAAQPLSVPSPGQAHPQ